MARQVVDIAKPGCMWWNWTRPLDDTCWKDETNLGKWAGKARRWIESSEGSMCTPLPYLMLRHWWILMRSTSFTCRLSLHRWSSGQSERCHAVFYHCNNIGQINSEVEKKVVIILNNDGVSGNSWRISIVAGLRVASNPQSHQKGDIQHLEATPDSPE